MKLLHTRHYSEQVAGCAFYLNVQIPGLDVFFFA